MAGKSLLWMIRLVGREMNKTLNEYGIIILSFNIVLKVK